MREMPIERFIEFQELCKPLIKWLNENYHPHVAITITPSSAELSEGLFSFPCTEYWKD